VNWGELLLVNPRAKVTVETVGRGKHRVVLVDDYYRHPDQLVELAQALCYVAGTRGSFPGTRAVVSLDTRPLIATVSELWGSKLESIEAYHPVIFSSIVNNGVRLTNNQRQPHIDPGMTAMVYLNADEHCAGGTALYRHKLTGLERIPFTPTPEIEALAVECGVNPETLRTPAGYTAFQDSVIFNPLFAARGNSYMNDGNDFWEFLYLVEMKFNRLVIIDGRVPHSQYLKDADFKDYSRLTQALYLKSV
jgi:hypothetical protein